MLSFLSFLNCFLVCFQLKFSQINYSNMYFVSWFLTLILMSYFGVVICSFSVPLCLTLLCLPALLGSVMSFISLFIVIHFPSVHILCSCLLSRPVNPVVVFYVFLGLSTFKGTVSNFLGYLTEKNNVVFINIHLFLCNYVFQ